MGAVNGHMKVTRRDISHTRSKKFAFTISRCTLGLAEAGAAEDSLSDTGLSLQFWRAKKHFQTTVQYPDAQSRSGMRP